MALKIAFFFFFFLKLPLEGFLSGLTSKVTSFVSGRAGMMTALKSSACNSEFASRDTLLLHVVRETSRCRT